MNAEMPEPEKTRVNITPMGTDLSSDGDTLVFCI